MELDVIDFTKNKLAAKLKLTGDMLSGKFNEALVHQVVTSYMEAARQGSKANKNRSAVRGGGAKPWRQKGTGRARAGSRSSPIWRSGGVTFAASARSYAKKVNRKMYRGAMTSILSELLRNERLRVVKDFSLDNHKTRNMAANLGKMKLQDVLIVSTDIDKNLYLATRNIPNVGLLDVAALDPLSLISYENVLLTESALKKLEESFA